MRFNGLALDLVVKLYCSLKYIFDFPTFTPELFPHTTLHFSFPHVIHCLSLFRLRF